MSEGSIHNKQIIFKVNNKNTEKKSKDPPKVNPNDMTDIAMVSLLSNRDLCAELTFH